MRVLLDPSAASTEFANTVAAPLTGALRMGIIATIAPFLLPRILTPLRERFPARAGPSASATPPFAARRRGGFRVAAWRGRRRA